MTGVLNFHTIHTRKDDNVEKRKANKVYLIQMNINMFHVYVENF